MASVWPENTPKRAVLAEAATYGARSDAPPREEEGTAAARVEEACRRREEVVVAARRWLRVVAVREGK